TYVQPGFSCTVGGLTFQNFSAIPESDGTNRVELVSVLVTPITTPHNEGLQFSAPWFVGNAGGVTATSLSINYTVTGSTLRYANLFFNGATQGAGTSATATESVCPGGPIIACADLLTMRAHYPAGLSAMAAFPSPQ